MKRRLLRRRSLKEARLAKEAHDDIISDIKNLYTEEFGYTGDDEDEYEDEDGDEEEDDN